MKPRCVMRDGDDSFGRYQSAEQQLWNAVRKGKADKVDQILAENKGIDLECRSKDETLVWHALKNLDYGVAEALLKAGAKVDATCGHMEFTPFIRACGIGDETAIELLVKYHADVNARTKDEETGLHRAAWGGHNGVIRRLVEELDCDVNAKNYLGQTAVFVAVSADFPETIRTLIELGADADMEGSNGFFNQSPRAFADSIPGGDRQAVAATLDDKQLRADALSKAFQPVTRKPVSVSKPISFKPKAGGGASFLAIPYNR